MTTALPPKQFTTVNGRRLAHVEMGQGEPIVLLHGNPTSSYLWRDVMPPLAGLGRVIAPDLIGHGDSDKLPASQGPGRYRLEGRYDLLATQLAALIGDQPVTLVLHDWGSALGFHWARLHPQQVRGIAYMEAIVMPIPSWDDWPEKARGIFEGFRSPKGEDLVLKRNLFIEGVLPSSILRKRSRLHPGGQAARVLPQLAQPAGDHGAWPAFHPGRLRRGHRLRDGGLAFTP